MFKNDTYSLRENINILKESDLTITRGKKMASLRVHVAKTYFTKDQIFVVWVWPLIVLHAGANYYIRPFGNSILKKKESFFCKIFKKIY